MPLSFDPVPVTEEELENWIPICDVRDGCITSAKYNIWHQGTTYYACGVHLSEWMRRNLSNDHAIVKKV